ncbi:MAG: ATP cone domain-containing protein [Allomuricauda sp.]
MKQETFKVKKYSGELEDFSIGKLEHSLQKCGADPKEIAAVVAHIEPWIHDGISTDEIHRRVFSFLKKTNRVRASKYSLKRAIFELGPTGYPFERMVGALLTHKGYKTTVGVVLQGACVEHEIDVLAEKQGNVYAIECKFHSDGKRSSNVKVPLYINSRFLDVQRKWNSNQNRNTHLKQGWLVTNTRFTTDAISYGNCIGLTMLSWNHPKNNDIPKHVDRFGLYPITALTTLSKHEKRQLLDKSIILTMEIEQRPEVLKELNLSSGKTREVLSEVHQLCHM